MTSLAPELDLEALRAADARIAPHVRQTPLIELVPTGLRLKAESLQTIGAFKQRGAFNALLSLSAAERARGVLAFSSGNHAQAVAYAASILGVRATVVMPSDAPRVKLEGTRRWGAEVILVGPGSAERAARAAQLMSERDHVLVPPFDAWPIMQGTATIGLEILAAAPEVRTVYAPVSGGGLLAGVAAAVKQLDPTVRVIGVEPELADDAAQSVRSGERVILSPEHTARTIADGLRAQQLGEKTWSVIRTHVDDIVTVSEDAMKAAMRQIAREARLIAEPSGAVAIAGALAHAADPNRSVAVLSGGNVDMQAYAAVLTEG